MIDLNVVKQQTRILIEADLRPVQSPRFQPTGFPDLGAAVFERPDGVRMLLVESAQSMANRLEAVCLKDGGPDIMPELDGLPYVRAALSGKMEGKEKDTSIQVETCTSSLIEAHRINSPFIITDKTFQSDFAQKACYSEGNPLNWKNIAKAVFHYDPNSILHGVFMANLGDGRVRLPRAITGVIEAEDIREAVSGGVKNNPIDPTGKIRAADYDKDVYGNVPYHRTEYTARRITAFFNLDMALLHGYGLPEEAFGLLVSLGLFKVRQLLARGLRLRTACDLEVVGAPRITQPADGLKLPEAAELLADTQKYIQRCAENGLFAAPPVTEISTKVVRKKEDKKAQQTK